jgi:hypothetical protein
LKKGRKEKKITEEDRKEQRTYLYQYYNDNMRILKKLHSIILSKIISYPNFTFRIMVLAFFPVALIFSV